MPGKLSGLVAKVPASHELNCNENVTMSALPLRAISATPTLAEAMEPLRLFVLEEFEPQQEEHPGEKLDGPTSVSVEHLEAAEEFLHGRADGKEALATIQATILLCESTGDISEAALERVRVDDRAFPLAAAAVEWTRAALMGPRASWPEGFWPRFLLGVLAGEQPRR
jgi:hypothetical protein